MDASALLTFERNHPQALAIKEDVTRLTGKRLVELAENRDVFGIIGGPPCQGFSIAGKNDPHDMRNRLPYEYARILKEVQPTFFLMENVKGLLFKKQQAHFKSIISLFENAGFQLYWKLLNAWDYGVAQTRERVFIIGFRKELKADFEWPEEDPRRPVLSDAIGDLPDPLGEDSILHNHVLSNPNPPSMMRRLQNNGQGAAYFDCKIIPWDRPSATITAHLSKDVDLAHPGCPPPNHQGHLFDNVNLNVTYRQANRVASWQRPANTITAHARTTGIHPDYGEANLQRTEFNGSGQPTQPRRFTVRECARIQSFPDSFVFTGSLTAQYRQVGNAVPPRLARLLAEQIAKALRSG